MSETKEYSTPELVKRIAEEAPLFFSNIGKDWVFSQGEYEEFIDSLLQSHRPSVTREEIQELIHIIGEFTIVGTRREDIDIWFKSREIEVKEKK